MASLCRAQETKNPWSVQDGRPGAGDGRSAQSREIKSGLLGKEVVHAVSHKPVLTAPLPAVRQAGEDTVNDEAAAAVDRRDTIHIMEVVLHNVAARGCDTGQSQHSIAEVAC